MWIKLLKDFYTEDGFITAGSVYWARRSLVIKKQPDDTWRQDHCMLTLTTISKVIIFPDDAEGDLFVETNDTANRM